MAWGGSFIYSSCTGMQYVLGDWNGKTGGYNYPTTYLQYQTIQVTKFCTSMGKELLLRAHKTTETKCIHHNLYILDDVSTPTCHISMRKSSKHAQGIVRVEWLWLLVETLECEARLSTPNFGIRTFLGFITKYNHNSLSESSHEEA